MLIDTQRQVDRGRQAEKDRLGQNRGKRQKKRQKRKIDRKEKQREK